MQPDSAYKLSLFEDEAGERYRLTSQAKICFPYELPVYREFGLESGIQLLDVGSGNGEPACLLKAEGLHVTCIDRDPAQVAHLPTSVPFVSGDSGSLPFEDETFDASFSRLVFQHLPDPLRTLREMSRVVRSDGHVVVCDTDHTLRSVFPPLPLVDAALDQWMTQARSHGADPAIGARLPSLFHGAGLEDVRVRIVPITTDQIGARPFADILFAPFVAMMKGPERAAAEESVCRWVQQTPFAAAFFTIIAGRVPSTK